VTPKSLQQIIQWTKPLNPINQRITTLINASSLPRYLSDQKGGMSIVAYLQGGEN